MLTTDVKRHIDAARQVLVGVVPNPTSQIDQITNALIYKFMDDMDQAAIKTGDEPSFFTGDLEKYAWSRLMDTRLGNQERMNLYVEAFEKLSTSKNLPVLFREILRGAYLPYRQPEVLGLFLNEINFFDYSHPEELGNAYEYLLSIMSSQGDAGQFRTPRDIIDFIVKVVDPSKDDKILDPACGTGGFLISAYKHISSKHDGKNEDGTPNDEKPLTPDDRKKLMQNFEGYDIDPGMVRIAQVNMYLHQFKNPKIFNYNTLSSEERWSDKFDVMLANPPFMSPKGGVRPHSKFSIESSRSEVLFVDYIMHHLRPKGRAGIIVPEGIIFQSGSAHQKLRELLVKDGLCAVVSLPSGVFQPYSGVKTSILFFDNGFTEKSSKILFVDVKDIGYSLGASKTPTKSNDLIPAVKLIAEFRKNGDIQASRLAFVAEKEEIASNGYDLSLARYKKRVGNGNSKSFHKLGDLCTLNKGKSSSTKTEPGPYPLILTAEEQKTSDHIDFDGEGVCVPLISATGHGKAAIKRVHYVSGKFALANLLAFVEPKDRDVLDSQYLYYCLDGAKDEMAKLMRGAANVSMKVEDLEKFQIPLPSIDVQKEVVEQITVKQAAINHARAVVENLERERRYFARFLGGVERVKIGSVVEVLDNMRKPITKSDRQSGKYPYYGATGVVDYVNDYLFDEKLVLVGEDGAKWGVGDKTAFVVNGKYWVNNHAHVLRPNRTKVLDEYLVGILNATDLSPFITGVTVPKLNQEKLRSVEIPLPSMEIQQRLVEEMMKEENVITANTQLIEEMEGKIKEVLEQVLN